MSTTTATLGPRVYVGTWKKYNEGNLDGKWVCLSDFSEYSDFLRYCRTIHSNERDPELMIQDCENFPDGLSVTDWLSEQDFIDVKSAMASEIEEQVRMEAGHPAVEVVDYSEKAVAVIGDTRPIVDLLRSLGGRFNARLSCGPGWIFSKRKEEELRKALAGDVKATDTGAQASGREFTEALARLLDSMPLPSDKTYYKKSLAGAIQLPEGYITEGKPRIENQFCFHDEGPDYEFYCSLMADENKLRQYFLSENLDYYDRQLQTLADPDVRIYIDNTVNPYKGMIQTVPSNDHWFWQRRDNLGRELTEDERARYVGLIKFVRDGFEKRLNAYLKKYGVSKLHTWTYWADR